MKTILTLTLFFTVQFVMAQPFHEWSFGLGSNGIDQPRSVTTDDNGNVYVVGIFTGTVDFDPGPGVTSLTTLGFFDCFIQKLNPNGDLLWVKSIGVNDGASPTFGLDVTTDPLGNVAICGEFRNTIDFDPGVGVSNLTAFGGDDGFVLKLDSNGDFLWVRQFSGSDEVISRTIAFDVSGNLVCGGEFRGTVDFDPGAGVSNLVSFGGRDFFIVKLDPSGDFVWANGSGNSGSDLVQDLTVDALGNILITGSFEGTVNFNYSGVTTNLTSSGGTNAFVQKVDPSGTNTWVRKLGGSSGASGGTIDVDLFNNVVVGGGFSGSGIFGSVTLTSNGNTDMFLTKYNASGTPQWSRSMGTNNSNDIVTALSIDNNNDIVFTGLFQNTVDFDPGPGVFNLSGGAFTENSFICSIDEFGDFGWAVKVSSNSDNERTFGIAADGVRIFVTGYFDGGVDLDPTTGVNSVSPIGSFDLFTLRLNRCEITTSTINPSVCSSYTSPSGNNTWSTTGTYQDIISNSSGCDSVITINLSVEDLASPAADDGSLSDVVTTCGQSILSLTAPTATDNCAGAVTGTPDVSFPITAIGTTTVTWTYDDGNGNTSTQTQDVIINADVTAPVADVGSLLDLTDECEITSLTAPTATDNCVGAVTGTHSATLPITSTTTITWTYDDGNGNTSTQTQEVIIDDVTAPVADAASLTDLTDECEITALTVPTATDNCAGTITGTHNATLPITSTTTITWTYDDGNGNTSTQTQEVIINDITAPVADAASLADLTDECEITALTEPTATDNCAGSVTVTNDATLPITSTTTITWTYDDGNGNTSTQTQEVIITPIDNGVTIVDDITLSADASGYTYQWVDCENGNAAIAGQTNQTFEATANGSYAVVIDNGDCSVTSTCFDITTVGLDKNEIQTINVFPNPTSGTVTINSSAQFNTVEVVNVMGQVVYKTTLNEVSTHQVDLPEAKGVYLIKVSGNNTNNTFRIIKK